MKTEAAPHKRTIGRRTYAKRHPRWISALRLGFCLRTWGAIMVARYAAFWLRLESASTAVVTVGILALQTRGQAYEKAPSSGPSRHLGTSKN